jgi:hypothetical protein
VSDDRLVKEIRASEHRRKRTYWIVGIVTVALILMGLAAGLYLQNEALQSLEAQGAALEELIEGNRKADQRFTRFAIQQHRRIEALLLEIARRAGLPVRDLIELLEESETPDTGGGADSDGGGCNGDGSDRPRDGDGNGDRQEPRPRRSTERPCDVRVDPVCIRTSPTPDVEISPSPRRAGGSVDGEMVSLAVIWIAVLGILGFAWKHRKGSR